MTYSIARNEKDRSLRKMGGRYRRGGNRRREISPTDEKIRRIGALSSGGNQNYVVYVCGNCRECDVPIDRLLRGEKEQGGASVMVILGVCHKGIGAVRFSPQCEKVAAGTKSGRICDGNGNASPPLVHTYPLLRRRPPVCCSRRVSLRPMGIRIRPLMSRLEYRYITRPWPVALWRAARG